MWLRDGALKEADAFQRLVLQHERDFVRRKIPLKEADAFQRLVSSSDGAAWRRQCAPLKEADAFQRLVSLPRGRRGGLPHPLKEADAFQRLVSNSVWYARRSASDPQRSRRLSASGIYAGGAYRAVHGVPSKKQTPFSVWYLNPTKKR